MSILLSQSSHPPLTPPCPHVHPLSLHLYFCLENKFNLTRHGDSSIGRNEVKLQMKKNPKNHKELRFKDSTRRESKKQLEGKDTAISGKVRKESFVGVYSEKDQVNPAVKRSLVTCVYSVLRMARIQRLKSGKCSEEMQR